jgi:tetratricopeptide (TPR) repeat protein
VASEREETLKKAEKLLRQGKLDLAIAEYVRVIEEQPRDWNTRNTLGDLYVRAGQPDKAAAQYAQIADHLTNEGFFPRAAALYKKILKIKPDEESVQLNLAEISAKQGLLADAKAYFMAVANRRRARGDQAAADEIVVRLGSLDPGDFEARALAARTLAQNGDSTAAAIQYRAMHADLLEKGRRPEAMAALREAVRFNHDDIEGRAELAKAAVAEGDLEAAKAYLDRAIAGDDPDLLMPLMEIELRAGAMDAARDILTQVLGIDPALRGRIIELAWTLASASPDAAYVCVDASVDAELAAGNYMDAAAILQEFVTRASGQITALLKLVEICVDGGLEATMYETQAHLADAYLERGEAVEARVIAEDLVAREPWEHAHIERFRRALVMLEVPDPDALIAERLSGQGPFVATDPFTAPESFGEPEPPLLRPHGSEPEPPVRDPEPGRQPEPVPEKEPPPAPEHIIDPPAESPPPRREPEPDIPLRPRVAAAPPAPHGETEMSKPQKKTGGVEIDLSQVLAELQGITPAPPSAAPAAPAPAPPPQNLDQVFDEFRSEVSKHTGAKDAAEQLTLARTYLDMGMEDEAIAALKLAARSPSHRFEAGTLLGRMYLKRKDVVHAVEWLERAAEAPAPGVNEARELLYDLGCILEASGETSRALAVFLELQADAGDYRDLAERVDRLARVQAGG